MLPAARIVGHEGARRPRSARPKSMEVAKGSPIGTIAINGGAQGPTTCGPDGSKKAGAGGSGDRDRSQAPTGHQVGSRTKFRTAGIERAGALALSAVGLLATPVSADPLQEEVLKQVRAARETDFAFTRRTSFERDGAPAKVFVHRFDPRRLPAQRWTLLSVDGRAPTPKDLARARRNARQPVPGYGEIAKWFGSPAVRTTSADGEATYRFARLPDGVLKIGSHDASPHTSAEAVVNTSGPTPFVESVRLSSGRPFRVALVASVRSLSFRNRYRPAPDGRPVPADSVGDVSGSLFGRAGRVRTRIAYSDFQALR